MAQYDDPTKAFMEEVASGKEDAVRAAIRATHGAKNPVALAARLAIASNARKVWNEEKTSSVSILGLYEQLSNMFGSEWHDWEPETIWSSLVAEGYEGLNENVKDAILALQLISKTNQAHENWHIFEKVGHAFNFNNVDFSVLQPLELDEVALTLKVLNKIRPKQEFELEVDGYIASCARNCGVVYLPSDLFPNKTAQDFLDELNNDIPLKNNVSERWSHSPMPRKVDPLPLKVQLLRLEEIKEYATNA